MVNIPNINYSKNSFEKFIIARNSQETIDKLPDKANPIESKMNTPPAFSFNKEDECKERNVFFLNNNEIKDNTGSSRSIKSLITDYSEDVDRPPIFETHVNTSALNQCFMKARGNHAFIGFRFTQYENGKYKRKHFKIGCAHDGIRVRKNIGCGLKIVVPFSFGSALAYEGYHSSAISTQTVINVDQSKRLLDNISLYFKKYPRFNYFTRNCNAFVRTMAKEIGLDNIVKLHNTRSPASAANRISKELSKGRNLYNFRSDFSTDRYKYKSTKDICDISDEDFFGSFSDLMGKKRETEKLERKPFMETATEIARQDLSIFGKLNKSKHFRSSEAERAVRGISDSINALNDKLNKGPSEDIESCCEDIKKKIYISIPITGKKHLNLNVYLMRVYNLIDYTEFTYKRSSY